MPFEYNPLYHRPTLKDRRMLLRSLVTGQCTIVQHPDYFAQCFLNEVPPKLLFRFLCMRKEENAVAEYVRLFPKHRKAFRLCRFAVSKWIRQLQHSYYSVHVAKTKTLHQVPLAHARLVEHLHHDIYRKKKTPITYAVAETWFYTHCHAEDALWHLLSAIPQI